MKTLILSLSLVFSATIALADTPYLVEGEKFVQGYNVEEYVTNPAGEVWKESYTDKCWKDSEARKTVSYSKDCGYVDLRPMIVCPKTINVNDMHFDNDSDVVREEDMPKLVLARNYVDRFPVPACTRTIEEINIIGHASSPASHAYNDDLSKRRALSVAKFLLQNGIETDMVIEHKGETQPVASNRTQAGQALNRRVVVRFLEKAPEPVKHW